MQGLMMPAIRGGMGGLRGLSYRRGDARVNDASHVGGPVRVKLSAR